MRFKHPYTGQPIWFHRDPKGKNCYYEFLLNWLKRRKQQEVPDAT
ncbi:MAG TPA: hypothetical protein VNJ52_04905 [Patescibacteria group bacterium]|nr:hypothetical protein [Patescibacteria group bacterium]